MREGDLITHINGKAVADYSDEEMTALFGTAGNEVQLSVTHSDDTAETLTITVARVSRRSGFVTDYEGIMYVRITQFDEDTGAEFLQAMEKIEAVGCRGMILDLRDNGGGYESQADIVADRILPAGVIAYSEDKNGNRLSEILSDETCINVPLAVLVNGRTAMRVGAWLRARSGTTKKGRLSERRHSAKRSVRQGGNIRRTAAESY